MKIWNKIASILTTMVTTISLLLPMNVSFTTKAADVWDNMSLTAEELVDDITFGWNLGNTLDAFSELAVNDPAYYETSASNPITEKHMLDTVKASGINAVRIPVTWFYHMDENHIVDEVWMNRVQEVVDYVIDNDMYCIINVHHDGLEHNWLKASMTNYNTNKEKFRTLWQQIAERFQDYDEHLLFEGFNEVTDDNINWSDTSEDGFAAINSYNQLFVDTVRATGGNNANRCLVCNTYAAASTTTALEQYQLPVDPTENRLIAEVHSYEPYQFCFAEYPNITTFSGEFSTFYNIEKYLLSRGIPTIIGEFACYDKNNLSERIRWADNFTKEAAELGVKCFWWDDGNLLARSFDHWKYPELLETCLKNFGVNYTCPNFPGYGLEKNNLTPYLYNYKTYFEGGLATMGYYTDSSSITMHILDGGTATEDIQLFYNNVNLKEEKQYKITFDAQCEGIDSLASKLIVAQVYPSFKEYFKEDDIVFSNNTKSFEYIFSIDELEENYNFNFVFCIGNGETDKPYDITISNLMVTEYTGEENLKGDVNLDGNINIIDAVLLQRYLLNQFSLTAEQGKNADIHADETVNVLDMMLLKKMLLEQMNQNLLPDLSDWTYHVLDGSANVNIDAVSKTVNTHVTEASAEQWQIETQAGNITLERGKTYQLTFDASCTMDTEMLLGITRVDNGNYPVCWRDTAKLSTDMQTYTYTFTSRYSTQSDFYLYLDFGNTVGDYIVKNVKLTEIGANLLPDTADWTHYVSSGSAEITTDAQMQKLRANVTADGAYEWDIQAQARNITLEKGKKYKLSIDMACSEKTTFGLGILHQVGSEYPACWSSSVQLTPEVKTYTFLFNMNDETNSDWYLYFNFAEHTGNYVISNAILTEYSIVAPAEEYDYAFEVSELCCNNNEKNIYGLSYVPKTDGKVPLVILSHELCGTHKNMERFAEALAGNGYAAYIFDFCGGSASSQSDGATTEMSVMTEVSDLEAILQSAQTWDFVDPNKIVLLGGSQGGIVTAITASKHIDEICGTILFYPAFILRDQILSQFQTKEEIPDTFVFHKWISVGRNYAEDIWDYDFYSELKKNTKPVMILHGDADTVVPMSYSEKAVDLYPNSEYHIIPNGGHGFYDQPFETAKDYILIYLEHLFTE